MECAVTVCCHSQRGNVTMKEGLLSEILEMERDIRQQISALEQQL